MAPNRERYAAFSDESRHSVGRYRSIATISLDANLVVGASDRVRNICKESGVRELKWHNLAGARERFCAIKIIDYICDDLIVNGGRLDILVWDTQDVRHRIANRDDRANYERMFFHLRRRAMQRRATAAEWHLRPDERVDIDWTTVQSCLQSVGNRTRFNHPLFSESGDQRDFVVRTFRQVVSADTPLCQVADLFASVAPYTREKSAVVRSWLRCRGGQQALGGLEQELHLSRIDQERLQVVEHLYSRCRSARLGVSLKTDGFFRSRRGTGAINFWHYEPQHLLDRAPTRGTARE